MEGGFQVVGQGAVFAAGGTAAVGFADGYGEGVELVEELGVSRDGIGGEGLAGEIGKGFVGNGLAVGGEERVAVGDAAEVFVGDGDGVAEGVEKDGIGGFRADARQGKETLAELGRGRGGHAAKRAGELGVEQGNEGFERGRLARVEAGGLDEAAELVEGDGAETGDGERTGAVEIGDGALDGLPGGVLGEVGADDDFDGGFGRPPVLRAVSGGELIVHAAEALGGCGGLHG